MATIEPGTERSTVLPGAPPYTVDDLLKFPDDGNRYELFNGSLLVSPAPLPLHQRICFRLQVILTDAAPPELEPLATVNLRVTDRDFYIPDLVVVPTNLVESVGLMFSPEHMLLAVEVGSPSTNVRDRILKTEAYAEAGIPLYWRIEPDEGPALYVYELDGDSYDPPAVFKAGAVATPPAPFPVSFDPAELVRRR
ncbi:Uma2 family endonuclease [Actinomadura sp. ATCC 31491]|uniref:Uma2 family endonuclease n=1 Tax=Actinomadura luzonensis TaxID=2805427 RepID=A0ABT0G7U4_9ACTN|nr:Uma2 family endonuclease [Actinomadura luzonensis]MCK2220171.1 Uma2 family endonuclease [Actinomadura luzonensis]